MLPPDSPARIARDDHGLPAGRTLLHAADSITRRLGSDVRSLLMSGSVFVMQVAHPVVGAGVAEHSTYRTDPWSRLRDIDASGKRFVWSDEASSRAEGRRLRVIHRGIAGHMPDGSRYHALDPHGYGWVHTVFLDAMIRQTELFGDALTRAERHRLFLEWYEAALFLGLRDRALPGSLDEYRDRFATSLAEDVSYTSVVAHLLGDRRGPPPPSTLAPHFHPMFRHVARRMQRTTQWLALAGLPPSFRERIASEHPFGQRDGRRFERFRKAVRLAAPALPKIAGPAPT